jgi:hypothetical protein
MRPHWPQGAIADAQVANFRMDACYPHRMKLAIGLVILATASAQTVMTPDEAAKLVVPKGRDPLQCQVVPLRPVLDFSFRFQAGYILRVPLDQYRAGKHQWALVTRIEPERDGKPEYLVDRLNFSTVEAMDVQGEVGGGYLLGEGRYRALFAVIDEQGRVCRADWNIEAKLTPASNSLKLPIPPGTVQEISLRGMHNAEKSGAGGRLTVLLHAVPVSPRLATVQANDAVILLGALSSLLESVPARSVKLIVFSLDQETEIYRQENFKLDQLPAVQQAIFNLQLATVSVKQLQRRTGYLNMLKHLVEEELSSTEPADEVVFLGPLSKLTAKPSFSLKRAVGAAPRFTYLEYLPPRTMDAKSPDEFSQLGKNTAVSRARDTRTNHDEGGNGTYVIPSPAEIDSLNPRGFSPPRDSIDYMVSMLKGKTFVVNTPTDFAKAVRDHLRK